jgi:hypothetical protein
MPNPQAGEASIVGCPRLLIHYIRSYPPYLEAISSIRNLRMRHAVMTTDPPIRLISDLKKLGIKFRSLTLSVLHMS